MTLVLLMGGTGQRFAQNGATTPKPFLLVKGRLMLDYTMDTLLKLHNVGRYLAFLHPNLFDHWEGYRQTHPAVNDLFETCVLPSSTRGPLDTILCLQDAIPQRHTLLLADCDSFFEDPLELPSAIECFAQMNPHGGGGVTIRPHESPAYAYVRLDARERFVREVREKDPFTPYSTTGPYWFRRPADFIAAAIKEVRHHRYSVAPTYNHLIQRGLSVRAVPVHTFTHLGSPEEVSDYERSTASPITR